MAWICQSCYIDLLELLHGFGALLNAVGSLCFGNVLLTLIHYNEMGKLVFRTAMDRTGVYIRLVLGKVEHIQAF